MKEYLAGALSMIGCFAIGTAIAMVLIWAQEVQQMKGVAEQSAKRIDAIQIQVDGHTGLIQELQRQKAN